MSRLSKSLSAASTNKSIRPTSIPTGVVLDVILDESHPRVTTYSDINKDIFTDGVGGGFRVGGVVIRTLDDKTTPLEKLPIYMPETNDVDIPVIGEEVYLIKKGNVKYYQRMSSRFINDGDASPQSINSLYPEKFKPNKSSGYSTTSQTGTPQSSTGSEVEYKFGEYFTNTNINKLKLYEGDRVIQSRFGQSIRFSAYNNEEKEFSPTIIIRNRQNDTVNKDKLSGDLIEENIIEDGSIISLSSEKYELPFIPGNEESPLDFGETIYYNKPDKLDGDQILVNSGRVIISSKTDELLFFSKGNYSFVSEGNLTIDNLIGGASLDFGDDVTITTDKNSSNVWVNTGSGEIRLNTTSEGESPSTGQREPLARGETLKGLLEELIDLINKQVFSTPSGPTKVGPNNNADFNQLKGRLSEFLSEYNFTE